MTRPGGGPLVAVLDSLPFAVVSVDPEGNILFLNRAAAANLSKTPDVVEGTSLFDHFSEAAALAARERIRQTISVGETQHFEAVVTLPDGSVRSYDSAYCPAFDDDGAVTGVQIVSIDTTDFLGTRGADATSGPWNMVADDLSMTNARVAALLENAPIVVSVYDPDMTIRYMNRLTDGLKMADVIGQTPLPWTSTVSRPVLQAAFDRVLETQEVAECEVTGISGASHWLVRLAPLVHDGKVKQIVGCTLDITELKRLQTELAQRQKTESLGTMARGVAHDFNNLLTAIMSHTGMIRRRIAGDGDVPMLLDEIDAASRRAADLCERMLVYSGQNQPSDTPGNLNAVLEEMAPLTRAGVTAKIQLEYDLADDLPSTRCSTPQLGQVVMNLINNAADAIGDAGGRIDVSTDCAALSEIEGEYFPRAPAPGRYVRLRVADTGRGMSPECLPLIFDPFYSTKSTGHGLGLSVVLGILAAHGAAIHVDSAAGRGTTMTVLLPAHDDAAAQPASPPRATDWPAGRGTVLVVDDVDAVRRGIARILTEAGYDVLEASDGDAGLALLAKHASAIRAIVLDVTMPGRDGYDTLAELRRRHRELPVLLSSGKPLELSGDDPFVHFLPKPYSADDIVHTLASALANA